jgi:hypothetical protein
MKNRCLIASLIASIIALPAAAQHADILVTVESGRLQVAAIDKATGTITPTNVFAADLGETGIPHYIDEPGLDAEAATLPPGSTLGFTVIGPLLRWDGASFVPTDAEGCAEGETMTIQYVTLLRETACADVPGFALAVQPDGGFHKHYVFGVQPGSNGVIDSDVYALQFTLRSSDPAIAGSDPVWIVFNDGMTEEDHDAAIAFLEGPACAEDLDGSGSVDGADLGVLLSAWGGSGAGDLDANGIVDGADLGIMLSTWGACP